MVGTAKVKWYSFALVIAEEISICVFLPGSMESFRGVFVCFFGLTSVAEFGVRQFILGVTEPIGPAPVPYEHKP